MSVLLESFDFTHNGVQFVAEVFHDDTADAPWDREDGHGPVTDWTTRDKAPGELILASDGRRRRYYDFAEACRIARRDGWGFLPGRLQVDPLRQLSGPDTWHAQVKPRNYRERGCEKFVAISPDVNQAIRDVYAQVRASMTRREYAAGAARADFERLRAWCLDEWHYVGVRVSLLNATGGSEALWGIESDSEDYIREVARELADEVALRNAA